MKDYFHFGINDRILFENWKSQNIAEFLGSCFAVLILAIFHEFLRYLRIRLTSQYRLRCTNKNCNCCFKKNNQTYYPNIISDDSSQHLTPAQFESKTTNQPANNDPQICSHPNILKSNLPPWSFKPILTALFALHTTISFLLMLIFMTYNLYLCGATIIGLSVGHWVFFLASIPQSSLSTSGRDGAGQGALGNLLNNDEMDRQEMSGQTCCQ
ncbi:unnamed protein product [Gordionus sp. m RMFG-2023]